MTAAPGSTTGSLAPAHGGPDPTAVAAAATLLAVAGLVATLGLLVLTGADSPTTLADPGPATTTGLPLARYLQDLLGVLVVGAALVAAITPGPASTGAGTRTVAGTDVGADVGVALRLRAMHLLGPLAASWAAVTALVYLLTASDLSGRALPRVLDGQVQSAFLGLPQARAQLLVLLAATVLLVASRLRSRVGPGTSRLLLLVATAGLLPPAFVGHSAATTEHELAVASVSVHLMAGALWVGGLAVLSLLVLADRRVPVAESVPVVRSFSALALCCVVVIGASGLLNGSLRVDGLAELVGSGYGRLLLGKAVLLLVLVGFGWWHRRRSVVDLTAGAGRGAFVRLVLGELAVMVLTVAAAVVLARTPPPGV